MLSTQEIREHLASVSYRPGWEFAVQEHIEGLQLRIRADLEDSYNPGKMVELGIDTFIPPIPDVAYLKQWLLWRLKRIEIHEACEWFKWDGEIVLDPHAR